MNMRIKNSNTALMVDLSLTMLDCLRDGSATITLSESIHSYFGFPFHAYLYCSDREYRSRGIKPPFENGCVVGKVVITKQLLKLEEYVYEIENFNEFKNPKSLSEFSIPCISPKNPVCQNCRFGIKNSEFDEWECCHPVETAPQPVLKVNRLLDDINEDKIWDIIHQISDVRGSYSCFDGTDKYHNCSLAIQALRAVMDCEDYKVEEVKTQQINKEET